MRDPNLHMLCGTCHGEWKRGHNDRGLHDGLRGVKVKIMSYGSDVPEEYCCVCGQRDQPTALFWLAVDRLPENWCGGDHSD